MEYNRFIQTLIQAEYDRMFHDHIYKGIMKELKVVQL